VRKIIIGEKFGRLTVSSDQRINPKNKYRMIVDCICDCGQTKVANCDSLIYGLLKSCGCLTKERVANIPRKQPKQ